jgi:hypothetical protein
VIDRLDILDKARVALSYYQWMVEPNFDQEGEVQRAEAILAVQPSSLPPLLSAAMGIREWIESGGGRSAIRSASIRFWRKRSVLRRDLPLTGAAAFSADRVWEWESWAPAYLHALQREAEDGLDLLYALERAWFDARRSAAGRRRSSHLVGAIDLLAAAPLVSATTLAQTLRVAPKNALRMLDDLLAADLAVEVTHRSKRRQFGLKGVTPRRDVVRPPYRPEPGQGRGRPRHDVDVKIEEPTPISPPLTPLEIRSFDYTALDEAMAGLDHVVREVRRNLGALGSAIASRGWESGAPDEGFG